MLSVSCYFLHVFYIAGNQYQMESKRSETPGGFFWGRRHPVCQGSTWGVARGEQHPTGRARRPRRALVGCAHLGCPRTVSLLYKYPNIPETLGESTKINSSHRGVQNHQIQFRHHHGWSSPPPLVPLRPTRCLLVQKTTKSVGAFGLHLGLFSCD